MGLINTIFGTDDETNSPEPETETPTETEQEMEQVNNQYLGGAEYVESVESVENDTLWVGGDNGSLQDTLEIRYMLDAPDSALNEDKLSDKAEQRALENAYHALQQVDTEEYGAVTIYASIETDDGTAVSTKIVVHDIEGMESADDLRYAEQYKFNRYLYDD